MATIKEKSEREALAAEVAESLEGYAKDLLDTENLNRATVRHIGEALGLNGRMLKILATMTPREVEV